MSTLLSEATLRRSTLPLLRPEPEDRVLDLCCGTGSLAVRTKQELRRAEVVGCDIDPAALSLAG
jgi:methylase of polypeptide subunit release factors